MNSLVLATLARVMSPLLVIFSVFVLLRGHNEPGGGFIGGLLAAMAFILLVKAVSLEDAKRAFIVDPFKLAAVGLGIALIAGLWGLAAKGGFLQGVWPLIEKLPDGSKKGLPLGSVLLFDVGVYLVVIGGVSGIFFSYEDAIQDEETP